MMLGKLCEEYSQERNHFLLDRDSLKDPTTNDVDHDELPSFPS